MNIRLFVKPWCPWCIQAVQWLDAHGIRYETLDVTSDAEAFREMEAISGKTLAPVIDVDGKILADFGAKELAAFWKTLEKESA